MLKKLTLATTLALAVALLGFSTATYAASASTTHAKTHAAAKHASLPAGTVSIVGVNQPMASNAGQNELKVVRATNSRGKIVPGLAGKSIQYSDSGKGKDLMTGFNGKRVRVIGTLDKANNVFTVNSYKEIAGKKMAATHAHHRAGAKHMAKAGSRNAGSQHMAKADTKPASSQHMAKADTKPASGTAPATPSATPSK